MGHLEYISAVHHIQNISTVLKCVQCFENKMQFQNCLMVKNKECKSRSGFRTHDMRMNY